MQSKESLQGKKRYTFDDLCDIVAILRSDEGCPWDRVQTHESIRPCLIEEAYEVAEGIDLADDAILREELGDLLLQIVFHAQIAREEGAFTLDDVADEICRKMVVRHPHVFGDEERSEDSWDAIKARTKHQESLSEVLDGVARSLPAFLRATKLCRKAAKAGAPIPSTEPISPEELEEALFALASRAAVSNIEGEQILERRCEKFIKETSAWEKS